MVIHILLLAAGLVIGLVIAYAMRSALRQRLLTTNERLLQEQQTVGQLQQELLHQRKEKDELLSRAMQAEGANKFLEQQFDRYHQLQQEHQAIQKAFAIQQTQLESAHEKLTEQKKELELIGEK